MLISDRCGPHQVSLERHFPRLHDRAAASMGHADDRDFGSRALGNFRDSRPSEFPLKFPLRSRIFQHETESGTDHFASSRLILRGIVPEPDSLCCETTFGQRLIRPRVISSSMGADDFLRMNPKIIAWVPPRAQENRNPRHRSFRSKQRRASARFVFRCSEHPRSISREGETEKHAKVSEKNRKVEGKVSSREPAP